MQTRSNFVASSVPGARREVSDVVAALGAGRDSIFFGRNATKSSVRRLPQGSFDIVLFATHALTSADDIELNEPALVLAPTGIQPPMPGDGYLTASEIMRLHLRAKLVVLSACSTASSDGTLGAEALSGLASSFFFAGANTLLVSHWAVLSTEAPRITTGTIKRMSEGTRADEALQETLLDILKRPNYPLERHPAVWGPFVLVGN